MPSRGKVEPSQASFCSGYARCLPRSKCKGLATWEFPALPQYPSPGCILNDRPAHGLCFLPGEALKAAWTGALCRSRTGREAKSAPGPSTGTQVASVNSFWLIGRRRGCLPSGRPWRAGGWEGLRAAALELEGPSNSHLLQLLAVPGTARPRVGEAGQRRLAHSCDWSLECRPQSGCLRSTQPWVAGPPSPTGFRGNGGEDLRGEAALVAPFLPRPPLSCQRLERGSRGLLRIFQGGREGGVLSLPHIPLPWKPLGGTRLAAWARAALGTIDRGSGAP